MTWPVYAGPRLILLVEDDPDDVMLIRLALEQAGLAIPLFAAGDGQEAVHYLAGHGEYANRRSYPLPGLILLDLKMPLLNGFEVLAWLQRHQEFNGLPVVVLSSSDLEKDIQKAKALGATDFRVKPFGIEALVEMLRDLHSRWLDHPSPPRSLP